MSVLCPTPRERMLDAAGRPYFLWDVDMTLERFESLLREGESTLRAHLVAKLMRQAKPDDVFQFVSLSEIGALWPDIENRLGRSRDFWKWWMEQWGVLTRE